VHSAGHVPAFCFVQTRDGVRALLVDDVKLDLVSRHKWIGRERVERYFTNYGRLSEWVLVPAHLDGRLVLAVFPSARALQAGYFIQVASRASA